MKVFKLKRTFAAVILVGGAMTAFAQQMPPIPTDPNVRIGKLENGLTLHCTESRFYPGRRQPAWSGALPGAHVFQRNHSLPRQPAS